MPRAAALRAQAPRQRAGPSVEGWQASPRPGRGYLRATTFHTLRALPQRRARGMLVEWRRAMWLRRFHKGAVDLHRHASVQHVDRDHQQAPGAVGVNEEALDVYQRTARDADSLAGGQEGVRENRQVDAKRLLDCRNVRIRDHGEAIPSLSENGDEPSGSADRDVALLVHGASEEQISAKHRRRHEPALTGAPGPQANLGKENVEALGLQCVVYELFAVAARPERVPFLAGALLIRNEGDRFWQGFAPFSSVSLYG